MRVPPPALLELAEWRELTDAQRQAVRHLQISTQQTEYAGTVARAIDKREAHRGDDLVGLAALAEGRVIGFLLLMRGAMAPAWSSAPWAALTSMRIDVRVQGQGHGSAMLGAVLDWVRAHWPECSHVALSVDEENAAGVRAYARAGFQDLGRREPGRIGWVRYMAAALHRPAPGAA